MIVGRLLEQQKIKELVDSVKSEFVVVYGRRRVGKTFLVREYFKNKFSFHATGLANTEMQLQLLNFHHALVEYGSTNSEPPPQLVGGISGVTGTFGKKQEQKEGSLY